MARNSERAPRLLQERCPIKVNDYPLFYLLAVVDSIEPLRKFRRDYKKDNSKAGDLQKKWDKMTDKTILSEIYLQFDKKKKSMTISKKEGSHLDLSCMVKENTFEKWLDVDFTKDQDGSVTLTFS